MSSTSPVFDARYPVGRFDLTQIELQPSARAACIDTIAALPRVLRAAVHGLTDAQLDTPYRDGGWTVRQVVHHIPDSHANAYVRFRLALTEVEPVIRPYDEATWAELQDARSLPVAPSLNFVEALHSRWVPLLRNMNDAQYRRTLMHPEHGVLTLETLLRMYDWHSRHHTAHITRLRERLRW